MEDIEYVDHIEHEGIIAGINVKTGEIKVRLTDADDCGGCPAAAVCSISGKGDKELVRVDTLHPDRFSVGERVRLVGTERMHRRAIVIGTVIPCVAMLAVMVAVYLLTGSQPAAALCGLGATIFFFVLLYLMRDRVRHEFRFAIEKLS